MARSPPLSCRSPHRICWPHSDWHLLVYELLAISVNNNYFKLQFLVHISQLLGPRIVIWAFDEQNNYPGLSCMSLRGFLPYESKKVSKFLRLLHAKINTRRHGEVQKSCSIEHTPLTGLLLITARFGYYLVDPATLTVLKTTHQGLFF